MSLARPWKIHVLINVVLLCQEDRFYGNSKLYSLLISLHLLHFVNRVHVDYFDFFKGPSNSMELLNFFKEALNKVLSQTKHIFDCEKKLK